MESKHSNELNAGQSSFHIHRNSVVKIAYAEFIIDL